MAKLEKNNSQKKDLNQLKDVSGGVGDVNVKTKLNSKVETHSENNSTNVSLGGGVAGNFNIGKQ